MRETLCIVMERISFLIYFFFLFSHSLVRSCGICMQNEVEWKIDTIHLIWISKSKRLLLVETIINIHDRASSSSIFGSINGVQI